MCLYISVCDLGVHESPQMNIIHFHDRDLVDEESLSYRDALYITEHV